CGGATMLISHTQRGVKCGRPRKMTPHQREEALQRLAAGETMADVARTYAVDATTIGRLAASSLSSKARPPCEAGQTVAADGSIQKDSALPQGPAAASAAACACCKLAQRVPGRSPCST